MPSNVEVKARVKDTHSLLEAAKRLSSSQGKADLARDHNSLTSRSRGV